MEFAQLRLALSALALLTTPAAAQFTVSTSSTAPGDAPAAIDSGDLNGDGLPELLTTNLNSNDLTILENGGGTFSLGGIVPLAGGPSDAILADLDGTGELDFAAALSGSGEVAVGLDSGYPSFAVTNVAVGPDPIQVVALDLDRDSDLDLAVLHSSPPSITLLENDPAGTFGIDSVVPLTGLATPRTIEVGNFNKGTSDLVVTKMDGTVETVLFASPVLGPITLGAQQVFPAGFFLHGATTGDFDGDGFGDFAVVDNGANTFVVFLNEGPSFGGWPTTVGFTATTYTPAAPQTAWAITNGDFDCDGDLDLAITFQGIDRMEVQDGDGSGGFSFSSGWPAFSGPQAIVSDDLDGNEYPDLAMPCISTDDVTVLTNDLDGLCCHELVGGIPDAYDATIPTVGPEDACPGADLSAFMAGNGCSPGNRQFDDALPACDRCFGHSFENLPDGILSAELEIAVRPSCGLASNDVISLGLDPAGPIFAWSSAFATLFGTPAWPGGSVVLDLGNMPDGTNLLPKLNAEGRLDIYLQDDTEVDYAILRLVTCAPAPPGTVPSECAVDLTQDPLVAGSITTFTLNGLPGTDVLGVFLFSLTGVGDSFLSALFPGLCLLPTVTVVGSVPAAAGSTSLGVPIPGAPPCLVLHSQGLGLPSFQFSQTISAQFFD